MKILDILNKIISFIIKYRDIVFVIVLVLAIMFGINSCQKRQIERDISTHNINALLDSMKVTQSKLNGVIYSRDALLITKDDLEKALGISKKQIKELNKKLDSKVTYIAKLEGDISILNKQLGNVSYTKIGDNYAIHSKDSNQYYKVGLTSNFKIDTTNYTINNLSSKLDYLVIPINLTTGLTDEWTIFVNTDNPYVKFTNIQGAVVDKNLYIPKSKQNHWFWDISVGANATIENFDFNSICYGPDIYTSLSYNISRFTISGGIGLTYYLEPPKPYPYAYLGLTYNILSW